MSNFAMFLAAMTTYFTLSGGQMAAAHDGIHVEGAYARVSGENAKSAAVFMTLMNHSTEDDRLLSVTSDAADRAELHTHALDANGVMHMGEVTEGFPIAGQEPHMLDRGGDHIMLLGLRQGLKQGDIVTITLKFERGEELVVEVPVDNDRKPGAAAHDMNSMVEPASN
jgi:periplasmic copper chaperone A